ncbi:MAG: ABC transporter ATP-binding protein [Bacteroidia bacterium]
MELHLQNIGKKFERNWIFRQVNYTFKTGGKYAILGSNGSGKSTLLQLVSGYLSQTEGDVFYIRDGKKILPANFYKHLSLATPYLDLPEELSLLELLHFHAKFKTPHLPVDEIVGKLYLEKDRHKAIKDFSSGMRQRVRLGLSIFYTSDIVLLDEPTTHLDVKGIEWYLQIIKEFTSDKCLIISSNQPEEYSFCDESIHIEDYKKK